METLTTLKVIHIAATVLLLLTAAWLWQASRRPGAA